MQGYIVTVDGMYYKHPDITSPTPSRECLFSLDDAKKIAEFYSLAFGKECVKILFAEIRPITIDRYEVDILSTEEYWAVKFKSKIVQYNKDSLSYPISVNDSHKYNFHPLSREKAFKLCETLNMLSEDESSGLAEVVRLKKYKEDTGRDKLEVLQEVEF